MNGDLIESNILAEQYIWIFQSIKEIDHHHVIYLTYHSSKNVITLRII